MILRKEIIDADILLNEATGIFSFRFINPINTSLIKKNFFSKKIEHFRKFWFKILRKSQFTKENFGLCPKFSERASNFF